MGWGNCPLPPCHDVIVYDVVANSLCSDLGVRLAIERSRVRHGIVTTGCLSVRPSVRLFVTLMHRGRGLVTWVIWKVTIRISILGSSLLGDLTLATSPRGTSLKLLGGIRSTRRTSVTYLSSAHQHNMQRNVTQKRI